MCAPQQDELLSMKTNLKAKRRKYALIKKKNNNCFASNDQNLNLLLKKQNLNIYAHFI
jgi:hypothetical protein